MRKPPTSEQQALSGTYFAPATRAALLRARRSVPTHGLQTPHAERCCCGNSLTRCPKLYNRRVRITSADKDARFLQVPEGLTLMRSLLSDMVADLNRSSKGFWGEFLRVVWCCGSVLLLTELSLKNAVVLMCSRVCQSRLPGLPE